MKLGEESGYLPDMSEIIAKTAIVGGGADTSVTIDATNLSKDSDICFFVVFQALRSKAGLCKSYINRFSVKYCRLTKHIY